MIAGKVSHIPFYNLILLKLPHLHLCGGMSASSSYLSVKLSFSAITVLKQHYQSKMYYFLYVINLSQVPAMNLQTSAALQLMNQGRTFLLNCDFMIRLKKKKTEILHD